MNKFNWAIQILTVTASLLGISVSARSNETLNVAEMREAVRHASLPNPPWEGPTDGPTAQKGKLVAVVAEDLRNGGILGVAQGVREAAKLLEWQLKIFDAGGTMTGRKEAVAKVQSGEFDAMILIGSDAETLNEQLESLVRQQIPVVGWHAGPEAGLLDNSPLSLNVSTDPLEVARITAMAVAAESSKKSGIVIFTDSNFEIAIAKSTAMAEVIKSCKNCELLEIRDVAISQSHELMADVTQKLLENYGSRWTHALAINDIYFDYMLPELIKAGIDTDDLQLLSAGDGSATAFQHILTESYQIGTVAEPLLLHGWQLADELNRLLAGIPADGHIVPVHLVTPENVELDGGMNFIFDPDNGYRDIYRGIWLP